MKIKHKLGEVKSLTEISIQNTIISARDIL